MLEPEQLAACIKPAPTGKQTNNVNVVRSFQTAMFGRFVWPSLLTRDWLVMSGR